MFLMLCNPPVRRLMWDKMHPVWTAWHITAHLRKLWSTAAAACEHVCCCLLPVNKFPVCSLRHVFHFLCLISFFFFLMHLRQTTRVIWFPHDHFKPGSAHSSIHPHPSIITPTWTPSSSPSSSVWLAGHPPPPCCRVFSVEGWRAQSRGPRVSPNWTEQAVSARWSSPASAVPTKTGQWVSDADLFPRDGRLSGFDYRLGLIPSCL